jgi:hypothetical protein
MRVDESRRQHVTVEIDPLGGCEALAELDLSPNRFHAPIPHRHGSILNESNPGQRTAPARLRATRARQDLRGFQNQPTVLRHRSSGS